jgi:ring-1,2-phenylacetyl-CoA epoxidase subunit PaaE
LKAQHPEHVRVLHFLSRERRGIALFDGRLDGERIRTVAATTLDIGSVDVAFVCGPEAMAETARDTLVEMGMPSSSVHVELFATGRPIPTNTASTPRAPESLTPVATATVLLHGVETMVPVSADETLLEAAERAGLEPPFACRAGVCSTCRGHVSGGTVEMATNHALDDEDVARGYVLTCQATPCTPTLVVDYDRP